MLPENFTTSTGKNSPVHGDAGRARLVFDAALIAVRSPKRPR